MPTSTEIIGKVAEKNPTNLRFIPNDAMVAAEREAQKTHQTQQNPIFVTLGMHIDDCFEQNRLYREQADIDKIMLRSLAQRNSEYTSDKLSEIAKQGGSKIFIGLTGVKCRAAEAWINDVMVGEQKPWRLKPTPEPELPPFAEQMLVNQVMADWEYNVDVMGNVPSEQDVFESAKNMRTTIEHELRDEASKRAKKMETRIDDHFTEGNFKKAFDECITDIVTLKAGIIKGPILRKRKKIKWRKSLIDGRTVHQVVDEVVHEWERVSPFDMYPSAGTETCQEGELVERVRFTRKSLLDLRGVPNYLDDAIDIVLQRYGQGGITSTWTSTDKERAKLEDKGDITTKDRNNIEGREYWGSVQGAMLIQFGYDKDGRGNKIDPIKEYEINAIKVGQYIVYLTVNHDPLGRRPYAHSGWGKVPGSFWYQGVPELMSDLQRVCNASVRSLVNNMGISSGPQVIIDDINRIAKGQNITSLRPWKIWQFVNSIRSQIKAIDFFQPSSNAEELMGVFNHFMKLADDFTGIPAYTHGNERASGAGRTASGLSMLMNSAARGIKKVISRLDMDLLGPSIMREFEWHMLYDPDESIKGDVTVEPQGILAMIIKEQMASQRLEFLAATNNDLDAEIMGTEGRANVLRAAAEPLQLGPRPVVPGDDAIQEISQRKKALKEQMEALELQAAQASLTGPEGPQ
jgi:hypothetical protein